MFQIKTKTTQCIRRIKRTWSLQNQTYEIYCHCILVLWVINAIIPCTRLYQEVVRVYMSTPDFTVTCVRVLVTLIHAAPVKSMKCTDIPLTSRARKLEKGQQMFQHKVFTSQRWSSLNFKVIQLVKIKYFFLRTQHQKSILHITK